MSVKFTYENVAAEIEAIKELIEKHGLCVSRNDKSSCVYVRINHPGCAIGHRLTALERKKVIDLNLNNKDVITLLEQFKIEYFDGWPITVLISLQKIHDEGELYFGLKENIKDCLQTAEAELILKSERDKNHV